MSVIITIDYNGKADTIEMQAFNICYHYYGNVLTKNYRNVALLYCKPETEQVTYEYACIYLIAQ